jgi:hypothetical protein
MNVSAAAGCTPRAHSRPAIGTEAHSHPGRAVPARAALGTARIGDFGSSRARAAGDTSALMAPLIRTPRTRKGRAWTTMATNTVVQVRNATGLSEPVSVPREYRATTTSRTMSRPSTRRRGTRGTTRSTGSAVSSVGGVVVLEIGPASRSTMLGDSRPSIDTARRHAHPSFMACLPRPSGDIPVGRAGQFQPRGRGGLYPVAGLANKPSVAMGRLWTGWDRSRFGILVGT